MANDVNCNSAQPVIFVVAECLRRRYNYALARMDAQGVQVLHIADGDAVVIAVAHNLVFNLLPTLEGFFYKDLRRVCESAGSQFLQFLVICAEAGAKATQGVRRPYNDRVAYLLYRCHRFFHIACGDAPWRLDANVAHH